MAGTSSSAVFKGVEPDRVTRVRPLGSLHISEARELIVTAPIRAAYESNGQVAEDTVRFWGDDKRKPDRIPKRLPRKRIVRCIDEEVVWGGYFAHHYGHFLAESVSRLWPLLPGRKLEGLPVVCVSPPGKPSYVYEWLDAFGVRIIELPDKGSVCFKRMYVPEPAWQLDAWIAPEMRAIHLHVRRQLDTDEASHSRFLWISRAKVEPARAAYDERLLEWFLEEVTAFASPDGLPLAKQIATLESTDVIAGVVGSSFHTLLMTSSVPQRVYLCPRAVSASFVTQDYVLSGSSTFLHALSPAEGTSRTLRAPSGFRLLIPETLGWLSKTSLPELRESQRVSTVDPFGCARDGSGRRLRQSVLQSAVAEVIQNPLSVNARMQLGRLFEADGRYECALEQFVLVSDITNDYVDAPLNAARLFARMDKTEQAEEMARRTLKIAPDSYEAAKFT